MILGALPRARAWLAVALAAIGWPVCQAQSIEMTQERFAPPPTLPFAPAPAPKAPEPAAPPRPIFVLQRDQPIHAELQAWAQSAGWELLWHPTMSWKVFRAADLSDAGEITAAVAEVIATLRDEGKPVILKISSGNRVMEVLHSDEAKQ